MRTPATLKLPHSLLEQQGSLHSFALAMLLHRPDAHWSSSRQVEP